MDPDKITNEFLQAHLQYVAQTEPPVLMHIWSAVAGAGACMGRHAWLDVGIGEMFANSYVLLVGPPGTRKSTAINFVKKLVTRATDVRLAPDDTGGQRQGLLTALTDQEDLEEEAKRMDIDLAMVNLEELKDLPVRANGIDRHVMFVVASEFGSFMGQNNMDMVRFLIRMWDGDTYEYQLRQSKQRIEDPLFTLVGGTTPTDISMILPPEAIGQGFMSRIILVFARNKARKVARPHLNNECVPYLEATYKYLNEQLQGAMTETSGAAELLDFLYMRATGINDNRFIYYAERRQTHLLKLAMVLAASRRSKQVDVADVEQAELILSETEKGMPDALGEYGLSPLAVARQKMLDFVRYAGQPVHERILWAIMQRDMKLIDFRNTLAALINGNKIQSVTTSDGVAYVPCDDMQQALSMLAEESLDELLATGGAPDGEPTQH